MNKKDNNEELIKEKNKTQIQSSNINANNINNKGNISSTQNISHNMSNKISNKNGKKFNNNIINKLKSGLKKIPKKVKIGITVVIILIILLSICIPIIIREANAQKRVLYTGTNINESKYPKYKEYLDKLKKEHPNWQFTLFYTKLDWAAVIENEGHEKNKTPKNLISKSGKYPDDWRSEEAGDTTYDTGDWYSASDKAIKYVMDPRNLLNDEDIFELKEVGEYKEQTKSKKDFSNISPFDENTQTVEGLMSKTKGSFLEGEDVAKALIEAGKEANIDPYFIVARLIQEQGKKGTKLSRGYEYNGKVLYNPFNIGASGNSSTTILSEAAKYAESKDWDTIEKAIIGGIGFMNNQFMSNGQNTQYLQKFDVVKENDQKYKLYSNQYMQNLMAPASEATMLLDQYEASNTQNNSINFIIPIYENMPKEISEK